MIPTTGASGRKSSFTSNFILAEYSPRLAVGDVSSPIIDESMIRPLIFVSSFFDIRLSGF
jgi:hypothetical protein